MHLGLLRKGNTGMGGGGGGGRELQQSFKARDNLENGKHTLKLTK